MYVATHLTTPDFLEPKDESQKTFKKQTTKTFLPVSNTVLSYVLLLLPTSFYLKIFPCRTTFLLFVVQN
jgi:hypothetical protein